VACGNRATTGPEATPEERERLDALRPHRAAASRNAQARIAAIERLAAQAGALAPMEYDFLYDKGRHLLAIGYNVGEHRQDPSYYDLLASEARLSSFVAIAQDSCRRKAGLHWAACSRPPVANPRSCPGAVRCSST